MSTQTTANGTEKSNVTKLPFRPIGLQAGDEEVPAAPIVADQHLVTLPRTTVAQKVKALQGGERINPVPVWLRSWEGLTRSLSRNAKLGGWLVAAYAFQVPQAAALTAWWTALGALKTLGRLVFWLLDVDGNPRLLEHAPTSTKEHLFTRTDHRKERALRWKTFAFMSVATLIALTILTVILATLVIPLIGIPSLVYLVKAGKPSGKKFISPVVRKSQRPLLTSAVIARALASLGIPELKTQYDKNRSNEWFNTGGKPIVPIKTGWLATIDLPHGVTAGQIQEKRSKLASGLRRPLGAVWPEGDPKEHEGRLLLYVLDRPLSELPQPAWPLLRTGRADMFGAIPYGYDTKGELVRFSLMFTNLLIGAIPRQGKTFAVRVVLLAAALDPSVQLYVVELKGTGDLEAVQPIAHRYVSGPARDEDLEATMEALREVFAQLAIRADAIKKAGRTLCPENKVTRELANDRSRGLWPILLVIDEVQELFESEHAAEAEYLLKGIIKRGPALGIMLVLSTQKPDAKSLPTSISSNMGLRLCLRVADSRANNMILGDGAYAAGLNATLFMEDDKGCGLLRDGGRTARIVRSAYLSAETAVQVAKRALALRTAANTLSGDADGQPAETAADRLSTVADCLSVWPRVQGADNHSSWLFELEQELAEEMPDRYGSLAQPWLGDRLRAVGIKTMPQRGRRQEGNQTNRAGVTMQALVDALEGKAT